MRAKLKGVGGRGMRIKINGEITSEKLAVALNAAKEKFEDQWIGGKFYGANLYLNFFDEEGEHVELSDKDSKPIAVTITPPDGDVIKPAQSSLSQHTVPGTEAHGLWLKEAIAAAVVSHEAYLAANLITAQIIAHDPHFKTMLNTRVSAIWAKANPVDLNGQDKPMPSFEVQNGTLWVTTPEWWGWRQVPNPIWRIDHHNVIPLWAGNAWKVASGEIASLMRFLVLHFLFDEDAAKAILARVEHLPDFESMRVIGEAVENRLAAGAEQSCEEATHDA